MTFLLVLGFNWWCKGLAVNANLFHHSNNYYRISTMTFNIDGANGDPVEKSQNIVALINEYNPDVVFFAEFLERESSILDSLLKLKYPYSTYPQQCSHHYFYSKYTLLGNRRIRNENRIAPGAFCCPVAFNKDTITFYGCHLTSNNYINKQECKTPDIPFFRYGIISYLKNICNASSDRSRCTVKIRDDIKRCSTPVIVLGDMNDVSESAPLKILEQAELKDVWWELGIGYGATIHNPLPYRIDHILFSQGLDPIIVKTVPSKGHSDHDAIYAEFEIIPSN